jgi:membrane associated rhomboid family serine protease
MSYIVARDAETPEDEPVWHVPWHARVPAYLLAAPMVVAFILSLFGNSHNMLGWAVSGEALAEGRYYTLLIHMFAHGGIWHIVMNVSALLAISPPLIARMGSPPASWVRYYALFLASGLAGALAYLAINPWGSVPMLGASGAIYGLLGALLRLGPQGEGLVAIRSRKMADAAKALVKENLVLIALLTLPALLSGHGGGLAWEAHLGGFVFALFAGPYFLPAHERDRPIAAECVEDI